MSIDTLLHKILRLPYKMHVALDKNRGKRTTVVLIHGLGSSAKMWQDVTPKINDARVISIDLLGFGNSPKPDWLMYKVGQQASSLRRTLLKLGCYDNIILVGHSLGALVAIEYARKYSFGINNVILCSPPLYTTAKERDKMYIRFYSFLRSRPSAVLKSGRYLRLNKGMRIDEQTLPAYIKSLESGIENQDSYTHLQKLKVPVDIMYGQLDILLVTKNLKTIAGNNKNITLHSVAAGHEVVGLYQIKLISLIKDKLHIKD